MTIKLKTFTDEELYDTFKEFTTKFEEYDSFEVDELVTINNDIYFKDWEDQNEDR